MRLLAASLAILLAAVPAAGQITTVTQAPGAQAPAKPVTGSGVIMGQVVDARGEGVPGAIVMLQGGFETLGLSTLVRPLPGGTRATLTTASGFFIFHDLPAGSYSMEATKPGFLPGAYGRRRHGGQPQSLELRDGERQSQIRIPMWEFGAITGTVRDETGEPVVGVQVRALRRAMTLGRPQLVAALSGMTDDRGAYRIDGLVPGDYVVAVVAVQSTLPASVADAWMASRAAMGNTEINVQLSRAGLIPPSAATHVGNWTWHSGGRSTLTVPSPTEDGRVFVYPTTFHPSARTPREAVTISLGSGDERPGTDFNLQLLPATMVSGVVSGPDGPVGGLTIRLAHEYADELSGDLPGLEAAATVSDATGRFMFVGVPVGQYTLRAAAIPQMAVGVTASPSVFRGHWAIQPLAVTDAGATDVALTLRGGSRVSGRIEFDGALPRPAPEVIARLLVRLDPIDRNINRSSSAYMVNFDQHGNFTIPEVPPGRYYVIYLAFAEDRRLMPGWETKGASHNGRNVSVRPMDVQADVSGVVMTLTDHIAVLSGAVRDAKGQPDGGAAVVMFTTERELWTQTGGSNRAFRVVRTSETGTYEIRGVPAGEYFLAAIPDEDAADWQDPRTLESISKFAMRILMADSEKKSVGLTTKPVK